MKRAFSQVDVFTNKAYLGNPLAVVADGSGLSTEQMQNFARWTNLSETTFLLPPSHPEADYQVRIFTPGGELPFAGHPTLGSCFVFLNNGGKSKNSEFVVQQSAVGLVKVAQQGAQLAFAAPALNRQDLSATQIEQLAQALGISSQDIVHTQLLNNGPTWMSCWLKNTATVLALKPNSKDLLELGFMVGVAAAYRPEEKAQIAGNPDIEVRAFTPIDGLLEDPVTGSLNASLAQWLIAEKILPTQYVAQQGTCMQRKGRVELRQDSSGQVWVGGEVQLCINGDVKLA